MEAYYFFRIVYLNKISGKEITEYDFFTHSNRKRISSFIKNSRDNQRVVFFGKDMVNLIIEGYDVYNHFGEIKPCGSIKVIGVHRIDNLIEFKQFRPHIPDLQKRIYMFYALNRKTF